MTTFTAAVSSALARLFEGRRAPAPLRTLATYAARVLSMRAAGTADIITDDETIGGKGGLGGRPVLVGLPGVRLDMTGGDRVRLGFEAGALDAAELVAFEQDRAADRPVGRKGDRVQIGTLLAVAVTVPVPALQLTFTPAGSPFGSPAAPVILLFAGATIVGGITLGVPYSIEGWIATGSPEISLRRLSTEEIP